MRESWFWYLPWWETFSDLCSSVLLWCVWLAWTGELGIFPCSQWWCAEIGHRRLVPQFFLSRLGTFSTQIGFNGMANLTFFFSIAHRKITFSFLVHWLADQHLQSNSIWCVNFFWLMNIPNWSAVVLWQIRTDTLETWEANSHFPVPCPPLLGSKLSTLPSVQQPQPWIIDQTKQNRILKLE